MVISWFIINLLLGTIRFLERFGVVEQKDTHTLIVPFVEGYSVSIFRITENTHGCIVGHDKSGTTFRFVIPDYKMTDQSFVDTMVSDAIKEIHEFDGVMH